MRNTPNQATKIVSSAILMIATVGIANDAVATSAIMQQNGAPGCSTCHTGGAYTKAEGKAGLAAFLAAKTPTCVAPAVLKGNVCVVSTPTTPTIPTTPETTTCNAPAILQNGLCVTTPVIPTTCNTGSYESEEDENEDDDHDDRDESGEHKAKKHSSHSKSKSKPVLSATDKVSVHSGDQLKLAVTAFDCNDRPLKIIGSDLPKGAKLTNSYDEDLRMQKGVFTWTPTENFEGKTKSLKFKAVARDGEQTSESAPLAVSVNVLPQQTANLVSDGAVKKLTIASARYNSKRTRLEISGEVKWAKNLSKAARKNALLSPITFSDASTNANLGTAKVNSNGEWKFVLSIDAGIAPCSVNAQFQGATAIKPVKGLVNCQ